MGNMGGVRGRSVVRVSLGSVHRGHVSEMTVAGACIKNCHAGMLIELRDDFCIAAIVNAFGGCRICLHLLAQ